MRSASFLALALFALIEHASAFWRMPARGYTGMARMDPIVSPGQVSSHTHIVFGGGGFSMNADYDALNASTCTSTGVYQDKSAYWTPALYFQFDNGSFEMVPNVGGMLAYYLLYLDNLTAFPEGFQMVAGNPFYRNFTGPFPDADLSSWPEEPDELNQFFLRQRAIGFNCLNYQTTPEGSLWRHTFPSKSYMDAHCTDGLRLEMAFPSCGTGALSSPDQTHVAYPSLVKEGVCPPGYPVHYPFLFFETIWATNTYAGINGTFTLSTGDPGQQDVQIGGSSYHGDFMMGWDSADFLQQSIDTCTNMSGEIEDCPLFDLQSVPDAQKCKFDVPAALANEDVVGPRPNLPVDVPIQTGPQPATTYPIVGQIPLTISAGAGAASFSSSPTSFATSTSAAGLGPQINHAALSPVTAAPSLATSVQDVDAVIATSFVTDSTDVVEWLFEEVLVTVTASVPEDRRRHGHNRRQRRG